MPKMTMCYRCMCESVVDGRCTRCNAPAIPFIAAENELVLPPGTHLDDGNIMVGERLGAGGFGITYVARDKEFGLIALKEFVPRYMIFGRRGLDLMVNPDKRETYVKTMRSFHRESKLLSKLSHPNIVRVLFEMQENNTAYYGMELLQGEDLGKRLRNGGAPMDARELCELLLPVMDALIYLHAQGSLHRDLSPDNIFLRKSASSPSGVSPCLIDFGAASSARRDFTQTVPGVKKNGYSPQEQNWDRELQGPFTDVYAFSATLYYALTLKVPLPAGDRLQNGQDLLKPPSSINPKVTKAVDNVVMHGLALSSKDRIQDMIQLGREFCAAVGVPVPVQWRMGRSQWGAEAPEPPKPPKPEPPKPPKPEPPEPPIPEPPQPEPVPEPPEPPQRVDTWPESSGHSPANLFALLIDALVLVLLPVLSLGQLVEPDGMLFGLAGGAALMLVLSVVLVCVEPRGTLGQRMLGLQLYAPGPEPTLHAICYAALRTLLPLSLLDALIGVMAGSATLLERIAGVRVARRGAASTTPNWNRPQPESFVGPESFVSDPPAPKPFVNPNEETVPPPDSGPKEPSHSAELSCQSGEYKGKSIPLYDAKGLTVGRDRNFATLAFSERNSVISHKHCTLKRRADGWYLEDHSVNGTFVNKKRLPGGQAVPLHNGDKIQFGNEIFIFKSKARR